LRARITRSDNCVGQTIQCVHDGFRYNQQVNEVSDYLKAVSVVSVRHLYDEVVPGQSAPGYRREGAFSPDSNGVLIDLTIPGLKHTPQSEKNRGSVAKVIFKGDRLLYDYPEAPCIYSTSYLAQWRAFMVYFPFKALTDSGNLDAINGFKALHKTHRLMFTQTNLMSYCGVYLIGVRRGEKDAPDTMTPLKLKNAIVASCVTKMLLFADLFIYIPQNYVDIYRCNMAFVDTIGVENVIGPLRAGVSAVMAYVALARKGMKANADHDEQLILAFSKYGLHHSAGSTAVSGSGDSTIDLDEVGWDEDGI